MAGFKELLAIFELNSKNIKNGLICLSYKANKNLLHA